MNRNWSKLAQGLVPYVPGEQSDIPGLVKLNTNESPFGPSPKVFEAVREAATDGLRLYPDPQSSDLRRALADYHDVAPDHVFVGNGSDEVLAHAFAALLKQSRPLLFPDVTYSFYPIYCRLFDIQHQTVPLDLDMCIRVEDYAKRDGGAIVIANPNAPTGIALPLTEIKRLLSDQTDLPIVIDEAYVDFGAETAIPLIRDHPNLLVVRTFSKSRALAGLRVGYALGDPSLIEALTRVKDSFNSYPLGHLAQAGAAASLRDETYFQQTRAVIIGLRHDSVVDLTELGFTVLPSEANFLFARHPDYDGADLASKLRKRAVLVRHFSGPRTSDYLRISIGTKAEMESLLEVLKQMIV